MDAKSLAKSKRAHSLHHSKKSLPKQKSKAQSGGGTSDNSGGGKASGNQVVSEKAQQSLLPSNWDRYREEEEEFDLSTEDPLGDKTKTSASDVVLPKSKGADFRHLIAEAQSQSQSFSFSDGFPSVDDIFPGGFYHSACPMLSVRGEGILSWIEDDNFVVDDGTASSHEVSLLSLNLHALAEQLEKVDMSERLYIEADLLPPELSGTGSKTSGDQESDKMQSSQSEGSTIISEELTLTDISKKNMAVNQNADVLSSQPKAKGYSPHLSFNRGADMLSLPEDDLYSTRDVVSTHSVNSQKLTSSTSAVNLKRESSTFEAAAAEAELDMLLDSFSDDNLLDSSTFTSSTFPVSKSVAPTPLPRPTGDAPGSSKTISTPANLDDILDDLLEETSTLSNQNAVRQRSEVKAASNDSQSSFSLSVSKSKVLDDFDSWLDTI